MSRVKATLMLDPARRQEQLAFVRERVNADDIREFGDHLWVSMLEDQAPRFGEAGIYVQFHPDAETIVLPATVFSPPTDEPDPPADLRAAEPTGTSTAYYLVKYFAPPDESWIDDLHAIDGTLVEDVPMQAAVYKFTAENAGLARALPFVEWVGLFHPAYALSFDLAGREQPYSARDLHDLTIAESALPADTRGNVRVVPFSDLQTTDIRSGVQATGATIVGDTGHALVINATASQLRQVLKATGVRAVERHLERDFFNQRAGVIIGANQVRNFRNVDFLVNLDGSGEIVHVFDSGLDNGVGFPLHPDIAGRVVGLFNSNDPLPPAPPAPLPAPVLPTADFEQHGTHVTGSIAGNGTQAGAFPPAPPAPPANPTTARGVAPNAQIFFTSVNAGLPPDPNPNRNPLQSVLNFNNFIAWFQAAHNAGARVHNNSWGSNNNNQYTNAGSGAIDRFAYLNPDSVVLFSSGNNEGDMNNNGVLDMNFLGDEAVAKNIITVGACENETNRDGNANTFQFVPAPPPPPPPPRFAHANFNPLGGPPPVAGNFPRSDNANQIALFSQRGLVQNFAAPTRRRVKPDLVAPGTNVVSLNRVALPAAPPPAPPPFGRPSVAARSAPAAFYAVKSGTSMATPLVSGSCVLVRQYYRTRFGQLRRPALVEPTLGAFIDSPAAAPHSDGIVVAWVKQNGAANDVVAARFASRNIRLGAAVTLKTNVGAHPAIALARNGDQTLLLHRGGDNALRLSLFDRNLAPVAAFGTNGVVTLAPAARAEDDRRPALCIHGNEAAVAWPETGSDRMMFQRFRLDTGAAIDAAAVSLGLGSTTSPHPYLLHNGTRYAAVWHRITDTRHEIRLRFIGNDGVPVGAAPIELVRQNQAMREPHLAWNSRVSRFRMVWLSEDLDPRGDIMSQRFEADGSPDPSQAATRIVTLPTGNRARRPFIGLHPNSGYAVTWEDNTQTASFEVYAALLAEDGVPDGRIGGNRVSISDTPNDTAGFATLMAGDAITIAWNSADEINSDNTQAVYAVNLTLSGAFQAQTDPSAPILDSGRYVSHELRAYPDSVLVGVSLAWAGGPLYHLRGEVNGLSADLMLVRTSPDGLPDPAFGGNGTRRIATGLGFDGVCVLWAGSRLVTLATFDVQSTLALFDADGNPEATFGTNGVLSLNERTAVTIFPQLAFTGSGNSFQMFVAYGRAAAPTPFLRVVVLDRRGNAIVATRDLNTAAGTARHGWFHFVPTDLPARAIAVWHETIGANMGIRLNRYNLFLSPATMAQHTPPLTLVSSVTLPGDSQNACLAPRPVTFDPPFPATGATLQNTRRRLYGMVFQNLSAPAARWELRFTLLNRDGTLGGVVNLPIVQDPADHATDPQLVWHTNGFGLAWLQQLATGGPKRLMFALLDANGARISVVHQVSDAASNVQAFQLVWNGRSFRVAWTQSDGTQLHHLQSAIAVPRFRPPAGFNQPYQHPSSSLVRATLINGATNFNRTSLPNVPSSTAATHNPNDGYGWGRVNLRQSLAPGPPVTFFVRDDSSVASGRTARFEFTLPPDTRLLRITLAWTDPPGNDIVNNLNLRVTAPGAPGQVFVGNRWQGAPNPNLSAPLVAPIPADPFDRTHTVEQVVISGNPVQAGLYVIEVIGGTFRTSEFQQFPGQHFSLVCVGSGVEWPLVQPGGIVGPLPFF